MKRRTNRGDDRKAVDQRGLCERKGGRDEAKHRQRILELHSVTGRDRGVVDDLVVLLQKGLRRGSGEAFPALFQRLIVIKDSLRVCVRVSNEIPIKVRSIEEKREGPQDLIVLQRLEE